MSKNKLSTIQSFIKKEIVLVISFVLALISCFFVPVSKEYVSYIDLRVLTLLFCLMLIVAGFRSIGFFYVLANKLFKFSHTIRSTACVFVMMCFFGSMFITNDVSLILFVPFSIFVLKEQLSSKLFIFLVILETIAANLGSMLTPIGNPQNLYIYSRYNFTISQFIMIMLPYTLAAFVLLLVCSLLFPRDSISGLRRLDGSMEQPRNIVASYVVYTVLFALVLTTIARITPYYISLIVCLVAIVVNDRKLLSQVDYSLIMTFVFFFVLVGNMKHIPAINDYITNVLQGHELGTSIIASQFISNVPAAILLSSFTNKAKLLLIGVNIGGLGTMIASMASLISYKFYARENGSKILSYFLWFTLFNIAFLAVLVGVYIITF